MKFELSNSFEENLALFKAEAETIDADCAEIFFDNLALLLREGDAARDRAAIAEFHRNVLAAIDTLPDPQQGGTS